MCPLEGFSELREGPKAVGVGPEGENFPYIIHLSAAQSKANLPALIVVIFILSLVLMRTNHPYSARSFKVLRGRHLTPSPGWQRGLDHRPALGCHFWDAGWRPTGACWR